MSLGENPQKPFWSFNPKRGLLFFLVSLLAVPIHGLFYWSSWAEFFTITIALSFLIGIIGTFTEHFDF